MKKSLIKLSLLAGVAFIAAAGTSAQAQCSVPYSSTRVTTDYYAPAVQHYVTPAQSSCQTYGRTNVYTSRITTAPTCSSRAAVQYVRPVPVSACSRPVYSRPVSTCVTPAPVVVRTRPVYYR
ncbi:MAG: hypothetical protein P1V20_01570 [Verrucomicrobiales bacterium]|nr:hypothetical protein [Verrucomicrobiales bacterium]